SKFDNYGHDIGGNLYEFNNTTIKNTLYFDGLPLDAKFNIQHSYILSDDNRDEQSVYLNVSVPLDQSTLTYSHSAGSTLTGEQAVQHHDVLSGNIYSADRYNVSGSTSVQYEQNDSSTNLYDLSLSTSYNDKYITANGYGYFNSDGVSSVSGFVGTNTIFTRDGSSYVTKNKASSYFISDSESHAELEDGNSFLAVIDSKENGGNSKVYSVSDKEKVYPLDEFNEYEFDLDTRASDFYSQGDNHKDGSSYPGTIIKLSSKLGEIKSFISTFSDIDGNAVSSVECVGLGCVSTDQLTEGVYQFRVKSDLDYRILSMENQCVIPSLSESENMNLGNNFCMPPFEETLDGYQIAVNKDGKVYYYIGRFRDSEVISSYKDQLEASNINVITKDVNEYTYLFLKAEELLADNRKSYVDELMSYAIKDESTPYAVNRE
ncbi:CS1-pili formation C-terminal domain-containing protein, partial [Vibrio campbellii]|uniref:CS1-pili formation C-terminal domain-containing protein n=1 Tax=Vibrio campbellii TaxID=680 RepID=UPI000AA0EAFE